MKKHFLLWVALVFAAQMSWGVDQSYYSTYLNNTSGATLFTGVHNVAKVGYSSLSYNGLWTAYAKTDVYPSGHEFAGKIWDMYGGCEFTYSSKQCGTYHSECDCYNREHSIPKSWFGSSEGSNTPGSDIFHVVPTDGKVNGMRSNYAFGEVSSATYSHNGSQLGSPKSITIANTILGEAETTKSCSSSPVFEPIDEYKGDFARGYFGTMLRWASGDYQTFTSGDGSQIFNTAYDAAHYYGLTQYGVALLLKWHRQDPVSQKEIDRNNGIQETQGNRNPFIDYPILAEYIWGKYAGQTFTTDNAVGSFEVAFVPGMSDGDKNGSVDPTPTPIPADYYLPVAGLKDSVLKSRLAEITWAHFAKVYSYGSGKNNTWDAFWQTDRNEADNSVIDMYSNIKRYFDPNDTTASVADCDIEHMFPNSWFGAKAGNRHAYSDLHHLVPADYSANRSKSNRGPGIPIPPYTFDNGVWINGDDADGVGVFCPSDEYKGDFARAFFYVATTYGDTAVWQAEAVPNHMTNDDWHEFLDKTRNVLLKWHREDPVSEKEVTRNNTVARLQGNRNPFIDYPCLAEYIWGTLQGETFDLSCSDVPITKYTITWSVNGVPSSNQVIVDLQPTAPSVDDCSTDRVFVGWTTDAAVSGLKPEVLYKSDEIPNATEDATYYAVFADKEATGGSAPETKKFIFANNGYTNAQAVTSASQGDVTISFDKGTNSNAPKYYDDGTAIRCYGGNKISVLATGITQIVFDFAAKENTNAISANTGTYDAESKTWTGKADEVVFTIGGTSGHRRIKQMDVTSNTGSAITYSNYGLLCEDCTPEAPNASFDSSTKSTTCGGSVSNTLDKGGSAGAVTYTSSNTDVATVGSTGIVTVKAAGTTVITASIAAAGCYTAAEASYTLTVNKTDVTAYFDAPTTALQVGQNVTNALSTDSEGEVTYASSNTNVATVDAFGEVTAVGAGTARITANVAQTGCQNANSAYYDITITPVPTYNVTWKADGETVWVTEDVKAGASYSLPANPTNCSEERVFVGWTIEKGYESETTAASLITNADQTPVLIQDTTIYAVYADKETGTELSTSYKRISTVGELEDGDYLIVYEEGNVAFNGGLETLDAVSNTIAVTITNQTIESTTETDAAVFTLAKSGNYTIRSASGRYIGQNTDANGLGTSTDSGTYSNTISFDDSDGSVHIVSSLAHLRYNSTSGQTRFRYYKSGSYANQKAIHLYKKVTTGSGTGTSYSNYSTKCGEKVIVTFHRNYGENLTTTQALDENQSTALTANPWNRPHYTFSGWALSADGEKVYDDGESVSLEEDIDLYALWTEDPKFTLTFKNGEDIHDQITGYAGEEIMVFDPDVCDEYTFVGWSTSTCPTEVTVKPATVVPSVIPAYDATYYAIFSREVSGGATLTDKYQKITDENELTTANYVIAAYYNDGYGALSTTWKDSYYLAPVAVSSEQDIITTSDGTIIWEITVVGNMVSVYNETAKYLYIEKETKGTSTYYNLKLGDNTTDNKFTYTVDEANWLFTSVTYDDRVLEFYTNNKFRWAFYTSADAPVYLYKQQVDYGYTTYYVSSPACSGEPADTENVLHAPEVRKLLINGQLFILRDGKIYTIQGARVQ